MFWSQFVSYLAANRSFIPAAVYAEVRREGIVRVQERLQAGYASGPLYFSDLIEKLENTLAPKKSA